MSTETDPPADLKIAEVFRRNGWPDLTEQEREFVHANLAKEEER